MKMSKEIEAFGLVKRACELYIESTSHLIGTDIIGKTINEALDVIEQNLTKAQAQELNIRVLDKNFTYEFYSLEYQNYHYFVKEENKLTEEEFNLMIEVL